MAGWKGEEGVLVQSVGGLVPLDDSIDGMGPFRMDPRRPVRFELQRATAEQVELSLAVLETASAWPIERRGTAVHGFRKAAKRIRAALDLARDGGDRAAIRVLKDGFREAARALSRVRDRDALAAILVMMARRLPRRSRSQVLAKWKGLLLPAIVQRTAGRPERVLEEIQSRLRAMRRIWRDVHLTRLTPAVIAIAMERNWDRARDRFSGDWKAKDPEWLHETRKRCQRLQYQLMLLESWRPKKLVPARVGLAEIGEELGMARDTGLLLARTRGVIAPKEAMLEQLRALLTEEHDRSLRAARSVGRRVLKPDGAVIRRLLERTASEYASQPAGAVNASVPQGSRSSKS